MKHWLLIFIGCLLAMGCEKMMMEDDPQGSAEESFDYLWERIDQQYSFFDVKDVDWQMVYDTLRPKVYDKMPKEQLFSIMAEMLNTLKDGHVNLIATFDASHSDSIYYKMYAESNLDWNVVMLNYLTINHHTTGNLQHNCLRDSNVIYIRYASFSNAVNASQMDYIIKQYPKTKGIILDLRQNGGGSVANIWHLLQIMPNHGQALYTTQIKNGPKHEDFGPGQTLYAPADCGDFKPYTKPVAVLVDRGSYSATSTFAICTQGYENMILVGDTTGGGLGLPNGGELPNGWRYRFPVTRTLALDGNNYENGVPPDIYVTLNKESVASGIDNVIECACDFIMNH